MGGGGKEGGGTGGPGGTGGIEERPAVGRGGRGVFLIDTVLVSNIVNLLFTGGGGGTTGSTGRRRET